MDSDITSAKKKTEAADKKDVTPFRTPDEVAADDTLAPTPDSLPEIDPAPKPRPSSSWKEKLTLHWPPGKKEWITFGVIVLLIAAGIGGWMVTHQPKKVTPAVIKPIPKVTPKSKTVPSTLSGLPVDPSVNERPVTGVMIENSTDARPQAGLSQAMVVFEAIAEGGITRFLALYQDTAPDNIGPVRSARPYYELWNLGFDAGYAHVGGSPEALADIKAWKVRDLDQFYNSGAYHRISSRVAPHNVYTSMANLNQVEAAKGWIHSDFKGFVRKPKENPAKQPTAKTINIAISGPVYGVHYDYDAPSNSYRRSEGGVPHIDANTNTQISPKVVVALVMPYSLEADGYHSSYNTIGSGQVFVFQDGTVTTGTWTKTSAYTQFTFADSSGKPLKLNAGQTWLTAVGSPANVTYAP